MINAFRFVKRKVSYLFLAGIVLAAFASADAAPTTKKKKKRTSAKTQSTQSQAATPAALAASANGWTYVNGEWTHPEGYRYVNGQILRTTAKAGRPAPAPPGTLALENAAKLAPRTKPVPAGSNAKAAAAKPAPTPRKIQPLPAPQTGSHMR